MQNNIKGGRSILLSFLNIVFLPFIIYLFAILSYFDLLALKMPLHTVLMCGVLFIFALFFIPQNEYLIYSKIRKNESNFENSLKDFIRLNTLSIDGMNKSNACFDDFLSDYLHKLKPLSFAYIASSVFPMLGILGTFISIAISMPDFKSTNTLALENEISLLLGGVSTAFYVSIYGIFLTIWWMFFSKLGLARINSFKESFKYASRKYFWSKEELERMSFKKNYELLVQNKRLIDSLNDSNFFKELSSLHEQKFKSFSELFNSYEIISKAHTELANKSLEISVKNNEEVQEKLINFNKKIDKGINEIERMKEELDLSLKDIKNTFAQNELKSIQTISENINLLEKDADNLKNKISENAR